MFKTRRRKSLFKARRPSYNSYSTYRKKRQPLKRWQIVAVIPATMIALELLTRLGLGLAGKTEELRNYNGQPLSNRAYGLSYIDPTGTPYDAIPSWGELKVKASLLQGYELLPEQESTHWSINPQGFRASAPLELAKGTNEMRIFVMGGSAAFGQFSQDNTTTFASQLQAKLNNQVADQQKNPGQYRPEVLPYFADEEAKALAKPAQIQNKQYRVVNAAVPGYTSGNQVGQLINQVLPYQPDLIILVNGYDDLLLPTDQEATAIPGLDSLLNNPANHLATSTHQSLAALLNRSAFLKSIRYWILRPQEKTTINSHPVFKDEGLNLPEKAEEFELRSQRYEANLKKIAAVTSGAKIPLIVAIQPELTSRINHGITKDEQAILDKLGRNYPERIEQGYTQLRQGLDNVKDAYPGKVLPLTLTDLYDNESETVFVDPIHLTDTANQKLADKLYGAVTSRLQVKSMPFAATKP
jgi:lysophospholipase L1-like esterase